MGEELIKAEKARLRREAAARRKGLGPERRAEFSARVCRRLAELPELAGAGFVLSYMATAEELELSPLHDLLRQRDITLAFPRSLPGGRMEFFVPESPGAFLPGPFGILEPVGRPLDLERSGRGCVLVPCLAFDPALSRLGHGGGYYDRFLASRPELPRLCPAFQCQLFPSLPRESWDLPLDAAVTELGVYRLAASE